MDPVHARAWRALVTVGQQLPARLDAQLTDDAGIINIEYAILGALAAAGIQRTVVSANAPAVLAEAERMAAEGLRVLARGRVTLYEARGDYQLILDTLEEAGEGALRRAFEQLKAKLQAEGLPQLGRQRDDTAAGDGDSGFHCCRLVSRISAIPFTQEA